MSPTFIIGPPRSGTTLLKDLLALHPALTVHGEDFHRFHHDLGRFRHRRAGEDHYRLTAIDADAAVAAEYRAAVREACEAAHCERFVLKISTLSIQIDYIKAIFPNARFVQLVRDGRDTLCSMEDLRRALAREEGRERDLGPAPDPFALWCAEQRMPPHVRAAASWFYHVTRSWLDLQFLGSDSYLRLRYEDLVREPHVVLEKTLEFLEVERCDAIERALAGVTDEPSSQRLGFSTVHARGPRRIGRYAEELPASVRAAVAPLLYQPMLMLGYLADDPADLEPACAALGLDPAVWGQRLSAETTWFARHVEGFSPTAMLRRLPLPESSDSPSPHPGARPALSPVEGGPGGVGVGSAPAAGARESRALEHRPLLVDGAVVGTSVGVIDGQSACPMAWVQKQDRRHTFRDADNEWPALARQLDGTLRLADLRISDALVSEIYRLRELGFVAFL